MTTENQTGTWEDLDWSQIHYEVFLLQRRIYQSTLRAERTKMHKLQKRLLRSRNARLLATRKATEDSRGKHTAGVDGEKSLTNRQKMNLAMGLSLNQRPDPVKRVFIPKPGKLTKRPLGIPTIRDRARQHLIHLALEPQAEARYSPHQYGFRRGRSTHDAMAAIRSSIRLSPQWALRVDIEGFFDHLDHDAILGGLETFPTMKQAIRRILKSGILEGKVLTEPVKGTPQGGPLSPLLANMALAGLESAIEEHFPRTRVIEGVKVGKSPRVVIYADDITVLHPDRRVLNAIKIFIDQWLMSLGLRLNQEKTVISHTLEKSDVAPGFEFLGLRVQQFRVGKHQAKPFFKGVFTKISPNKDAMKRLNDKVAETTRSSFRHKRRNAEFSQREVRGTASLEEILIHRVNPLLRGWANYFRSYNSKAYLSRMDNLIHQHVWRWAKRRHKSKPRSWIVNTYFNRGNPWIFRSPLSRNGKHAELMKLASVPIERYIPVASTRSYFDGDWPYWARRSGSYPSIPKAHASRIKAQHGRCSRCRQLFVRTDRLTLLPLDGPTGANPNRQWVVHRSCANAPLERA